MLIVAIDFDDTFTSCVDTWTKIIDTLVSSKKFIVVCVTARHGDDLEDVHRLLPKGIEIIATGARQKKNYCANIGLDINIWIDDLPELIVGEY